MKTIGRLQFRHFSETFESREAAYKYLSDIVDATKGDDIARYTKACGKRSILQTKPLSKGFKIDSSKLGYEYEKSKYDGASWRQG